MPQLDVKSLIDAAKGKPPASVPTPLPAQETPMDPAPPGVILPAANTAGAQQAPVVVADLPLTIVPKPAPVVAPLDVLPIGATLPTPNPVAFTAGPGGNPVFYVQLVDNPPLKVEAEDRMDAIERYMKHFGIIKTVHTFDVRRV